jgi:hypothetical protein
LQLGVDDTPIGSDLGEWHEEIVLGESVGNHARSLSGEIPRSRATRPRTFSIVIAKNDLDQAKDAHDRSSRECERIPTATTMLVSKCPKSPSRDFSERKPAASTHSFAPGSKARLITQENSTTPELSGNFQT